MVFLNLFFLLLLAFALGLFLLPLLLNRSRADRFRADQLEIVCAILFFGLLLLGWLGLILTELGRFSIPNLLSIIALVPLLLILFRLRFGGRLLRDQLKVAGWRQAGQLKWRAGEGGLPDWVEYLLLAVWLLAVVGLYMRPHRYIEGAADVGLYVNLAAHVANSGGIVIENEALRTLDESLYPAFLRQMPERELGYRFWSSGFFLTDQPGRLMPQYYHYQVVWQALGWQLGGLETALSITPFWGILSNLAVYLTLRRLWGRRNLWVPLVVLVGLSVTTLQVWFVRYGTTEALTQALFWLGIWAFVAWAEDGFEGELWAGLAGLAWGMTFLTRIDTFLVWGIPLALTATFIIYRRWDRSLLWFWTPLLLLPAHSVLHALLFSTPYFLITFNGLFRLISRNAFLLALGALAAGGLLLFAMRRPAIFTPFVAAIRRAAATLFLIFFVYNRFLRPSLGDPFVYVSGWENVAAELWNHENLLRLGWYFSEFGLWVSFLGILIWILRADKRDWPIVLLGFIYFLLFVWDLRINGVHLYSQRRFVPIVVPFLIVAAGYLFDFAAARLKRAGAWPLWAGRIVVLVWLVMLYGASSLYIDQVDQENLPDQIEQMAQSLPENAVLLFNQPESIGVGDFLAVPLNLMHGHYPFIIHHIDQLDNDRFEEMLEVWAAAGHPLYWMALPEGHAWPLPADQLSHVATYRFETSKLEAVVDRQPIETVPIIWEVQAYKIEVTSDQ